MVVGCDQDAMAPNDSCRCEYYVACSRSTLHADYLLFGRVDMEHDRLHSPCSDTAIHSYLQAMGVVLHGMYSSDLTVESSSECHILRQTTIQGGLSGLILAWANELTGEDSESELLRKL